MRTKLASQLPLAGYLRRLFAYLLDWYIAGLFASLPYVLCSHIKNTQFISVMEEYGFLLGLMFCVIGIFIASIYYIGIPYIWRAHHGQTLGKALFGIRVVAFDQSEVSLLALCKRELLGVMILEGGLAVSSGYLRMMVQQCIHLPILTYWLSISWIVTFLSILFACFSPSKRMLHDYIGNSIVIRQQTKRRIYE